MATQVKIPSLGESISEVEIGEWRKGEGESIEKDETLAMIDSEKATLELPAPVAGTVTQLLKKKGETAKVGEVVAYIDPSKKGAPGSKPAKETAETSQPESKPKPEKPAKEAGAEPAADHAGAKTEAPEPQGENKQVEPNREARVMPAAERLLAEHRLRAGEVEATGPGGRLLKEDVLRHLEKTEAEKPASGDRPGGSKGLVEPREAEEEGSTERRPSAGGVREEEVVRMTRLRRTVAARLVEAQRSAALLTTFNEIDMSAVIQLRKDYGEVFLKKHGVKLGFMSFFVKASIEGLKNFPQINAEIRGQDIVYRNYYDIGVAIGGGRGLVVPILRHAERMSFAALELAIADLAKRAEENKLQPDELEGGTFTISNGGVYGSLLSTPIVNPPQSGILGLHAIQDRPVAVSGNVVVRPMMYVALTYDHRLVDGREAVTFLRRIKEVIESPARMLIEV